MDDEDAEGENDNDNQNGDDDDDEDEEEELRDETRKTSLCAGNEKISRHHRD